MVTELGSIEGDGAAAMRYTEARLEKITQEVYLNDLDKDVVDFVSILMRQKKEPEVLPVRVPNLLLNGARRNCGWYGNKYSASQFK